MARLIDTQLSAAGKSDLREQAPTQVLNRAGCNALLFQLLDEGLDIVAHEIKLMNVVLLRGMYCNLCWRQSEDQPAASNIDVRKMQHIAQECAVRLRIRAVNDRVSTRDHKVF